MGRDAWAPGPWVPGPYLVLKHDISADLALQGKRRVKQCLPLKSSSNTLMIFSNLLNLLSLLS